MTNDKKAGAIWTAMLWVLVLWVLLEAGMMVTGSGAYMFRK